MARSTLDIVARFILPLLAVAGYYCTYGLSERTGYFNLLRQVRDTEPQLLPGTKAPIKLEYTGIHYPVDHLLAMLATVFWPIVDGSYPHTSLQAFEFAGQAVSLWAVLEIEGRRLGNKWRLISLYV